MIWRLQYAQAVIQKLYLLRETGHALHAAIKALAMLDQPWVGALSVTERPTQFEIESSGYWVGFEVVQDAKTIRVLYIEE